MTQTLSIVFQIIILIAAGLFLTTFSHRMLTPSKKILGLSRCSIVLILGFSSWLLPNTPEYINFFFSILTGLAIIIMLCMQSAKKENVYLTFLTGILPILVLLFLKFQPYYLTFYYNSAIFTGLAITLGIIALFYIRNLKLGNFILFYLTLQIVALILSAINYNNTTLIFAASVIIFSDALNMFFTYQEINKSYLSVHQEASYYKDHFDDAVRKEVNKRTFYMELSKEKMVQLNRTDHLTKLLNRKSIIADIESLLSDRSTTKFVLFVLDIDYFKKINDTLGHTTGDTCLKNLASILKANAREYDLLGRFGGDEFIIALPMLGYKEGLDFGERLMKELSKNTNPKITISMGMSTYPWDGDTYKQLFEVADKGLYLAKEGGRNQIGYKGYIRT